MKRALIRFAPVFEGQLDPGCDRIFFGRYAFRPHPDGMSLLVDHDDDREIGRILELSTMDDVVDGQRRPWHVALVEGELPAWIRRGSPVSFGYTTLRKARVQLGRAELVRAALVREVSVLSTRKKPADVRAEVVSVREAVPAGLLRPAARAVEPWATPYGQALANKGILVRHFPTEITVR